MQILALVHRVPYPPDKGEKIRAFHELDHLYRSGHTLDLVTFADTPEDAQGHPELSRRCRRVEIVRKNPLASRARSPLALPRGNPLSVGYFKSYRAEYTVRRWLDDTRYDAVFCYSSPMAEYVRHLSAGHGPARIMDLVDVDSEKWKQYAQESTLPMKAVYGLEAKHCDYNVYCIPTVL